MHLCKFICLKQNIRIINESFCFFFKVNTDNIFKLNIFKKAFASDRLFSLQFKESSSLARSKNKLRI